MDIMNNVNNIIDIRDSKAKRKERRVIRNALHKKLQKQGVELSAAELRYIRALHSKKLMFWKDRKIKHFAFEYIMNKSVERELSKDESAIIQIAIHNITHMDDLSDIYTFMAPVYIVAIIIYILCNSF